MNWNTVIDYTFLYLFGVVELSAYIYFLGPLEKRKESRWRTWGYGFAVSLLLFLWSILSMTEKVTRDVYSYLYTVEYYVTIVIWIYLVYQVSFRRAVYDMILIFLSTRAIRHAIGHLLIVLRDSNYLVEGSAWLSRVLSSGGLLAVYLLIFTGLRKIAFRYEQRDISWTHLALIVSSTVPVVYSGAFAESLAQTNWGRGFDAIFVELVASFCGLLSVLGYEWMLEARSRESDLEHMEQILKLQHRQYETKKETMDLINQKYHDLKKSLNYLEKLPGSEQRSASIHSLEEELKVYETIFQTGNEMLDIVLFDKNERCQKAGIRLIFMLDGSNLSFLNPLDITAIFGNALDNAIEQAEKMERPDQKEITMKVSSRPGWLIIRFENYCIPAQLQWADGELQTTKGDRDVHGFGIQSIRYAVKKYGGNMAVDVQGDRFVMNIMFPLAPGGLYPSHGGSMGI